MNRDELLNELAARGVPSEKYSLSGGLPNEKYVLGFGSGKWQVYYSERGLKSGFREFTSESDACHLLLKWLEE